MPNLPTISVTDAQIARITAAYGDAEGYRRRLRAWVANEVISYERQLQEAEFREAQRQRDAATLADLGLPSPDTA